VDSSDPNKSRLLENITLEGKKIFGGLFEGGTKSIVWKEKCTLHGGKNRVPKLVFRLRGKKISLIDQEGGGERELVIRREKKEKKRVGRGSNKRLQVDSIEHVGKEGIGMAGGGKEEQEGGG